MIWAYEIVKENDWSKGFLNWIGVVVWVQDRIWLFSKTGWVLPTEKLMICCIPTWKHWGVRGSICQGALSASLNTNKYSNWLLMGNPDLYNFQTSSDLHLLSTITLLFDYACVLSHPIFDLSYSSSQWALQKFCKSMSPLSSWGPLPLPSAPTTTLLTYSMLNKIGIETVRYFVGARVVGNPFQFMVVVYNFGPKSMYQISL